MSIPDDVIEAMAARSFAAYVQNGDSGKDTPDGWVNNRRIAEIRAAIAAAEAKGWKLVPVEPTTEMCAKAADGYSDTTIWRAMLSAAPKITT